MKKQLDKSMLKKEKLENLETVERERERERERISLVNISRRRAI